MSAPAGRDRAIGQFRTEFGAEPEVVVRAPGRVNLIGEHTDYNDGFVLPMALEHATWIAARSRTEPVVSIASDGYGSATFELPVADRSTEDWDAHVRAMLWALSSRGHDIVGLQASVATDVPVGAGLSSSAALSVAVGTLVGATTTPIDPVEIALAAQAAEDEFLGVPTGIMDQLVSATAVPGHALLIDCRDLSRRAVPLPPRVTVVVLDTSTRRELSESRYAERRASCERVAAALGVTALRDADLVALADADLDETDRRRARHVIEENARTVAAADAFEAGECEVVGELMDESHVSMRDQFEISSPALDTIVEAAQSAPGCLGARMTGGGFAGCGVALVDDVAPFSESVRTRYRAATGFHAALYPARGADGACYELL